MKRVGVFLALAAVAMLTSAAAFAKAPAAPQPDAAKAAFLQSLRETPAAPVRPENLTGRRAPVLKACDCLTSYNNCKAGCGGVQSCLGDCWDAYQACRCSFCHICA